MKTINDFFENVITEQMIQGTLSGKRSDEGPDKVKSGR